jgi:hypothetical protein
VLGVRLAALREVTARPRPGWRDLRFSELISVRSSFEAGHVTIRVVRDEGGRGDELHAAREVARALGVSQPELAPWVSVVGEYAK